jgi:FkbM family methyltransferase
MIQRLRWFYRAWRYRLKVEKQEIAWLLQNLHPGDAAVDIGAHKGAFTYWMRKRVGPGGKVFAFEPQPELASRLQHLVHAGGYRNVVVENKGLSSESAQLVLKIPGRGSSPSASFEETQDTRQPGKTVSVDVTTLDTYLSANPALRIALLKCDTEGHELEVFRGAERLLQRDHPNLLFECEARHRPDGSTGEVFAYLEQLGYHGYCLGREGLFHIEAFDPRIHQSDPDDPAYCNNFLFTYSERHRPGPE